MTNEKGEFSHISAYKIFILVLRIRILFAGWKQCLQTNEAKIRHKIIVCIPGNRPNSGRKKKRYKSFQFAPVNPNHKKPGRRDLVYFESSSSYCEKDASTDFPGTYGRECNATSIGIDGCDLLCCGRGYVSKMYTVRERCSCIFQWCCVVKCEICTRMRVLHTCKQCDLIMLLTVLKRQCFINTISVQCYRDNATFKLRIFMNCACYFCTHLMNMKIDINTLFSCIIFPLFMTSLNDHMGAIFMNFYILEHTWMYTLHELYM